MLIYVSNVNTIEVNKLDTHSQENIHRYVARTYLNNLFVIQIKFYKKYNVGIYIKSKNRIFRL